MHLEPCPDRKATIGEASSSNLVPRAGTLPGYFYLLSLWTDSQAVHIVGSLVGGSHGLLSKVFDESDRGQDKQGNQLLTRFGPLPPLVAAGADPANVGGGTFVALGNSKMLVTL